MNTLDDLPTLDISKLPTIGLPTAAETKAHRRHLRRVESKRFARLEQNKTAAEHIGELPPRGTALHGAMGGRYSGWSLIEAVITLADPVKVSELVISTLGISKQNIAALFALLDDGRVRRVAVCISHYFRHSDPLIYHELSEGLAQRGQQCRILRNHAKLVLFALDDGRRVVLEGSFNCRSSMNAEQFLLVDDCETWTFHRGWLSELMQEADQCPLAKLSR